MSDAGESRTPCSCGSRGGVAFDGDDVAVCSDPDHLDAMYSAVACPGCQSGDGERSGRLFAWFRRPWDRCRFGHRMWSKGGYALCRRHENWVQFGDGPDV